MILRFHTSSKKLGTYFMNGDGLHLKGYNVHEKQLDAISKAKETYTFSRRRHSTLHSDATDIFIPDDDERNHKENGNSKQFALYMMNGDSGSEIILAPSEFHEDDEDIRSVLSGTAINNKGQWLEDKGFTTFKSFNIFFGNL